MVEYWIYDWCWSTGFMIGAGVLDLCWNQHWLMMRWCSNNRLPNIFHLVQTCIDSLTQILNNIDAH